MYKLIWIGVFCISLLGIGVSGYQKVISSYEYEDKYSYAWELADKSSTLSEKYKYINEFVLNIENNKSEFADNSALNLKTKESSFEFNLLALKSLQIRLSEISQMNVSSFEYQTAMQQITGQEQGEAKAMLAVLKDCYLKANHFIAYSWIFGITMGLSCILLIVACTALTAD